MSNLSPGYISAVDHGPAIRDLFSYRVARREWRALCKEEGISLESPLFGDPCLDNSGSRDRREPQSAPNRSCAHCGHGFASQSISAKFCSDKCRWAAAKAKRKAGV